MPIDTISQVISTIPKAGKRGVDVQTQFVIKQEDFQDHLQGTTVTELNALKTQINTTVTGMNIVVETVNAKTAEASASASSASTSANTATTKASEASASASSASTSATKAGQWADNDYNVPVEVGKYSAKHWSVVTQNTLANKLDTSAYTASDVLTKLKTVDGAGSGLDADTLDGLDSTAFMRKTMDNTITQNIIFDNGTTDSGGFIFYSNIDITKNMYVDLLNGALRFYRNNGLTPFGIGVDNNLYADNGTNGNGRILTATTPIGYASSGLGVGGTVTQPTSKTTDFTLNKLSGTITMSNAAMTAGSSVIFQMLNSYITSKDTFDVLITGGANGADYRLEKLGTAPGILAIRLTNISASTKSDAVQLSFTIFKGANS